MGFKDLKAYNKAFILSRNIGQMIKKHTKKVGCALTHLWRRCFQGVNAAIGEAYRKLHDILLIFHKNFEYYIKHAMVKLCNAEMETSEMQVFRDSSLAYIYVYKEINGISMAKSVKVGKWSGYRMQNPQKNKK